MTTSINKPDASNFAEVSVYPNPFASKLNITINALQEVESCEVFIVDISGKKIANIYAGNIKIEGQLISWKPNMNIKKGFYFCVVKDGSKKISKKIFYRGQY